MSQEQRLYRIASDGWKPNSLREEAIRGLGKLAKEGSSEAARLLERIANNGWMPDRLRQLATRMIAQ